MTYANPYFDATFFDFIKIFFSRLLTFKMGDLAADELQFFVLAGVALSSSMVGTFLVLKKMTMVANSLSHTILLGIAGAYYFFSEPGHQLGIPLILISAIIMGFVTVFLTEWLIHFAKLQEDAATALVFTTLFALGVIFVTVLTRSSHIGIEALMGNVDALQLYDVKLVLLIFLLNVATFLLFFKEFKITTFDQSYARMLGISSLFFNYLLMAQAALTVIGAFRSVGVLMVLSFITIPTLAARLLSHNLSTTIYYAMGLGTLASFLAVALSRHILTTAALPLSTAGLTVVILTLLFLMTIALTSTKARLILNTKD